MRAITLSLTIATITLTAGIAWADSTAALLQQDPNLVNIPRFPSFVTSSIAQQTIANGQTPRWKAANLPSGQVTNVNDPGGRQADPTIDRQKLYMLASQAAQSGAMELKNAYSLLVQEGYMMQIPIFNPPPVVQAGRQVVQAAMLHLSDMAGFDNSPMSSRRLADGGRLISRMGDAIVQVPLPQGPVPPGYTPAAINTSGFRTPKVPPPPPFNPGSNGPTTAPPPRPTTYVYTAANSNVEPVARNAGPVLPPAFQQVLTDRGVNPEAFESDFVSGQFKDISDFLRAAGDTNNYSADDLARAKAMADRDIDAALKKPPEKKSDSDTEVKPETGVAMEDLAAMYATERVKKKKKDPKDTKAADGTDVSLPTALVQRLAKQNPQGDTPSPAWFQWLTLGVFSQRPQNIFHIAHRQYQSFAPIGSASRREVAVLDF